MQLSEESVKRFQKIYEEEYNEEISFGEAREMATRLVDLYRVLARPLPKKAEHAEEPSSVKRDESNQKNSN